MTGRLTETLATIGNKLAPMFLEHEYDRARKTLVDCLDATRRVRAEKLAGGGYHYDDEPDYPIRVLAARLIIEWVAGKPLQRSIHADLTPQNHEQDGSNYLRGLMQKEDSKAVLLEMAGKVIEAAQKAIPAEVNVTPQVTKEAEKAPESQSGGSPR